MRFPWAAIGAGLIVWSAVIVGAIRIVHAVAHALR